MGNDKKYIMQLRCAFYPPYMGREQLGDRIMQFVCGIDKFFEHHHSLLKEHNVKVYFFDSTFDDPNLIPKTIAEAFEENNVDIVLRPALNHFGAKNKGAGEVGSIIEMKDTISEYEWFLHFEPRQQIQSSYFLESFFKNPRTLFTVNQVNRFPPHFNTGLYATKTDNVMKFVEPFNEARFHRMILANESLEYTMYNFYKNNNIEFELEEKMDLVWIDPNGKTYRW